MKRKESKMKINKVTFKGSEIIREEISQERLLGVEFEVAGDTIIVSRSGNGVMVSVEVGHLVIMPRVSNSMLIEATE